MRVHLGSDHAGLELKDHLLAWLTDQGHEVVDHGPFVHDPLDDYPVFCLRCAEGVVADQEDGVEALGVVIGGSGNGEQIAANKVRGVRSALAWSDETARLAREHNDANVLSVGGRMHPVEDMTRFVGVFLATPYSNDERHTRRIEMLADYEKTGNLPALPASAIGHGSAQTGADQTGADQTGPDQTGADHAGADQEPGAATTLPPSDDDA